MDQQSSMSNSPVTNMEIDSTNFMQIDQQTPKQQPQQLISSQNNNGENNIDENISNSMMESSSPSTSSPQSSDIPSNLSNTPEDKSNFMRELNDFFVQQQKTLSKIPVMGYKEIDLYQLYNEVILSGGYHQAVTQVGTWSRIWKRLSNYDPSITDSSFRLKKNYERFLLDYEMHNYPEHKQRAQELGLLNRPSDSNNNSEGGNSIKTRKQRAKLEQLQKEVQAPASPPSLRKRAAAQAFGLTQGDEYLPSSDYFPTPKRYSPVDSSYLFDVQIEESADDFAAASTLANFKSVAV